MSEGFVFAMNRNRDEYQVPCALHEAGVLREFVADAYFAANPPAWLPASLRRRHVRGLAGAQVRWAPASMFLQYAAHALRLPMHRVFPLSDRLLAAAAARQARRLNAPFYAYSSYMPERASLAPSKPVVSFEYHPHPALCLDVLERDFALHPEVAQSIAQERVDAAQQLSATSWQQASHIVCASSLTRRSLEFAGCPADRITVIPYGFDPQPADQLPERQNQACRFLFVGQGIQRKGLHHLLKAWRIAAPAQADLTLACYRIDPGIAALAQRLQADGFAVRLLPGQSRDELRELYRTSDVFAMPSLIEGFGLVYLEALREGCHVIASRNTGMADLALGPATANLVEAGDIAGIAEALTRAQHMWGDGQFLPRAIAADAARHTWVKFRGDIARHAAAVLNEG